MNKTIPVVVLTLSVLGGAGCESDKPAQVAPPPAPVVVPPPPQTPSVDVYESKPTANANHAQFKQVSLEGFQAPTVRVTDIRRSKTNDGFQRVQVLVKNCTSDNVRVSYVFTWEDENGVTIEDLDHSTWSRETVKRGDETVFTSIAPSKRCHDFKVRIKPVK